MLTCVPLPCLPVSSCIMLECCSPLVLLPLPASLAAAVAWLLLVTPTFALQLLLLLLLLVTCCCHSPSSCKPARDCHDSTRHTVQLTDRKDRQEPSLLLQCSTLNTLQRTHWIGRRP